MMGMKKWLINANHPMEGIPENKGLTFQFTKTLEEVGVKKPT